MTINEYQQLAIRTLGDGSKTNHLLNGVMGLCGESGECIDIVKKHMHQGHELDKEHLLEEVGDVAWYLAVIAHALDTDLEKALSANIEKLKKRYPNGFEAERSINRE